MGYEFLPGKFIQLGVIFLIKLPKNSSSMKFKLIPFLFALIFLSCHSDVVSQEAGKFPASVGYINDFGKLLDSAQIIELSGIIEEYEKKTTREISVVTVDSIAPYTDIMLYATDLGNYWGVGKAEEHNGVIMVICVPCRKIFIATGLGTEKRLKDEECKQIIDETMIPEIKKGNYFEAIKNGLFAMMEKWE